MQSHTRERQPPVHGTSTSFGILLSRLPCHQSWECPARHRGRRSRPITVTVLPGPCRRSLGVALPCLLSDGQSLPSPGREAAAESVARYAAVERPLHAGASLVDDGLDFPPVRPTRGRGVGAVSPHCGGSAGWAAVVEEMNTTVGQVAQNSGKAAGVARGSFFGGVRLDGLPNLDPFLPSVTSGRALDRFLSGSNGPIHIFSVHGGLVSNDDLECLGIH